MASAAQDGPPRGLAARAEAAKQAEQSRAAASQPLAASPPPVDTSHPLTGTSPETDPHSAQAGIAASTSSPHKRDARRGDEVRLQIPAEPFYLRSVRTIITHIAQRSDLNIAQMRRVQIVVTEVLSNIIQHTYRNKPGQVIMLRFANEDVKFTCYIRDFGERVPMSRFQARDLSEYREKGLGLHVINSLSDYVYYDRSVKVGTETVLSFNKDRY